MRTLCCASIVLAACGFAPTGDDDGASDDAAVDADPGDADTADAPGTDAALIDAAMIDARVIDAAVDAAVDARPPCPAAYNMQFQGSNYRLEVIAQVWTVASVDCDGDLPGRTHLATFEVAAELDGALSAINPGNNAEVLVGAQCVASDCDNTARWTWVTGSAVDVLLWAGGQPNNGLTEKVGASSRVMGTWKLNNVTAAATTRPYICECDP
jgi:hypothetical protein